MKRSVSSICDGQAIFKETISIVIYHPINYYIDTFNYLKMENLPPQTWIQADLIWILIIHYNGYRVTLVSELYGPWPLFTLCVRLVFRVSLKYRTLSKKENVKKKLKKRKERKKLKRKDKKSKKTKERKKKVKKKIK